MPRLSLLGLPLVVLLLAPGGAAGVIPASSAGVAVKGTPGPDVFDARALAEPVIDGGEGTDTLLSAAAGVNLNHPDLKSIENATTSKAGGYLIGNAGDNVLTAATPGEVTFDGDGGSDLLVLAPGHTGRQRIILRKGQGSYRVRNFDARLDRIGFPGFGLTRAEDVLAKVSDQGGDAVFALDGQTIRLQGVAKASLTGANFMLAPDLSGYVQTFSDDFKGPTVGRNWRTGHKATSTYAAMPMDRLLNKEREIYVDREYGGRLAVDPFRFPPGGGIEMTAQPAPPELVRFFMDDLAGWERRGNTYATSVIARMKNGEPVYTSGMIQSKPGPDGSGAEVGFGAVRFEYAINFGYRVHDGLWPAVWLLPTDGTWPPELDANETLGDPNVAHITGHARTGGFDTVIVPGINQSDGRRHSATVIIGPAETVFYLDDMEYVRHPTPQEWFKPKYLLANLGVGGVGDWPGPTTAKTRFPVSMTLFNATIWNNPAWGPAGRARTAR